MSAALELPASTHIAHKGGVVLGHETAPQVLSKINPHSLVSGFRLPLFPGVVPIQAAGLQAQIANLCAPIQVECAGCVAYELN